MDEFTKEAKGNFYDPVFKEKEEIKKFKKDVSSNKLLKENHVVAIDSRWYGFLISFFIIVIILGILGFLYLAENDAFKSVNNQEVKITPLFNATVETEFNQETNNEYKFHPNYTIYNNIFFPDNLCG